MKAEDLQWLRDLNKRSWDKDGMDLPIAGSDRLKLTGILEEHREEFVFEPCSGVFGFGIGLLVYVIKWAPYPGVPNELEGIIRVTCKQMFPEDGAYNRRDSYAFVEGLTHTDMNRKAREAGGIKTKLRDISHYDY